MPVDSRRRSELIRIEGRIVSRIFLYTLILSAAVAGSEARAAEVPPVHFRTDVIAALSHAGCNSGACHGSPQGKNGFRLSLRGHDADLDLFTLTRAEGGRRVDRLRPENSLFLLKGTGRMAHQGGVRLNPSEPAYRLLLRWVAEGCRDAGPSPIAVLEVRPERKRLAGDSPTQQLTVLAHFESGEVRDVTSLAVFSVNDGESASVSASGLVRFDHTAEATVLVRYLDHFASARLTYVKHDPKFVFAAPKAANTIDEHVFARQRELQLLPAAVAPDEVFLRRVHLDVIGTLPTAEEARAFLDSKEADKRSKLIDKLLDRDEFASFWALKWADVMRGSPTTLSKRGVHSFHRYLVRAVAEDRPMDRFARELLTGLGNTLNKPAASFYRVSRTPDECAETFAQLFLGVRLQCAKCHNHPFENITQTDYYGLAAYFAQVDRKGAKFMLDDEIIALAPGREVQNPQTRKNQEPTAFGSPAGKLDPADDRREKLADWLVKPDNPYFAPSLVNRTWYHLFGQGIVEPVDDFRATNPPSNVELLEALSADFVKQGYRLKPLLRTILNSKTYQLASSGPRQSPNAAPAGRYFVKARVKMLSAEQALDAVSAATGVPEKFKGVPLGTKAIELAEGGINHPFLQAFAKPVRDVSCECAREEDPSLPQMLHLLNNAGLLAKLKSPKSRLAVWLRSEKDPKKVIENVYLATLSRRPRPDEVAIVVRHIASLDGDRAKAFADLQFALMNSSEFLLRH
jgi:Protein of unknown function (DUF1553)/Protein of unknown function (DUF1549)